MSQKMSQTTSRTISQTRSQAFHAPLNSASPEIHTVLASKSPPPEPVLIHTLPILIPPPNPLPNPVIACFDVDDTLWNFIGTAFRGTPFENRYMPIYAVSENSCFDTAEKDYISNVLFQDPALFENIEFYPGVEKIQTLFELGIKIKVLSNNLSLAVVEQKRPQLKAVLPFLEDSDLILTVVQPNTTKKRIGPEVTFFIDDCPDNIIRSEAYINLLPALSWNTSPEGLWYMQSKLFHIFDNLNTIIDTIIQSVLAWRHLL